MKTLLNNALPVFLLGSTLMFVGCSSPTEPQQESSNEQTKTDVSADSAKAESSNNESQQADLKSGNVFYIARDVADVQLKAGDYISQLQQSQETLQQAIETQNVQQLESTVTALKTQLTGFNQTLSQLDLKSTEINDIRQNIMIANQQALESKLLNGQVDFSQVDFKKIEQQLGTVQSEMLKLAGLLTPKTSTENSSTSPAE